MQHRMRSRAAARASGPQRPAAPPPASIRVDGVDHRIRGRRALAGNDLVRYAEIMDRVRHLGVFMQSGAGDWGLVATAKQALADMLRLLVPTLPVDALTEEQVFTVANVLADHGFTQ